MHICSESSEAEESESEKEEDQTMAKSEDDIEDVETESGGEEDETDPTALSPGCEKPIFLTKQGTEGGTKKSPVKHFAKLTQIYYFIDECEKLHLSIQENQWILEWTMGHRP